MKIGIDARLYGLKNRGLGRYIQKLVDGLIKADQKNHYVVFLTKDNIDLLKTSATNVTKVLLDVRWYSFKEQFKVPQIINQSQVDLMYFPHFNVPLTYHKKFIVTIHDLIIDHFPDSRATTLPLWLYKIKLLVYKRIVKHTIKKAVKIITPSNFVKDDLIKLYQVPENKIKVIHEGYSLKEDSPTLDLSKFKINKPYLLYVGAAYPHKNLERLIKVFQKLNSQANYQLVLAGETEYFYKKLKEKINKENVIFTGFIPDNGLKALYQQALVYVIPSFYEGFGLTPIEAQVNGVPVVSSNYTALPEVLNDSAIFFKPDDENEMFGKIQLVLENRALQEQLIKKGYENIKRFSWEKMAAEVLKLFV
ncbi:glycosyltransferase family 4 protein [Patescibacteria group bacterium]|nr:glycosyltransferase family 4 protein [Patescibacteria group bacterium]